MTKTKNKKEKVKLQYANKKKKDIDKKEIQKNKRRKNVVEEKKTRKKTIIKNKQKIILTVIFLLIIVILIIKNYHKLGFVLQKEITEKDAVKITLTSSNNIIKEYQDEILVYSSGKYSTYDKNGKETWVMKLDTLFIPEINTAGKYIQIYNKNSGYVYIYYNKYESARIKIDGIIKSCIINEDGITIVEYAKAGSKTILELYDKYGKQLYQIKLNVSIVGQFVLSKNARYLAYTEVVTDGISVSTNVNIIDLKKANKSNYKIPTAMKQDNELVYKMFFNGNKIIALFGDKVVRYNILKKTIEEYDTPNINLLNIDISSKEYIYISSESNNYILSYLKFGDDKNTNIPLKDVPIHLVCFEGLVYIGYKKMISIYNAFGHNIKNYTSETILSNPIVFNDGKNVAVATSNQIIIFNI